MNKRSLLGLSPEEIYSTLAQDNTLSVKKYCGRQIFEWIYKNNANTFQDITNLPQPLRDYLTYHYLLFTSRITNELAAEDRTKKIQLTLNDENMIESVLLQDRGERKTACLSTQVGCGMNCSFCKTGQLGFKRNLVTSEIIEQFLMLLHCYGPISNIVFMGMGEPLQNLDPLLKACSLFIHPHGLNISLRKLTISTCGIIKGIYRLADHEPKIGLAISLITADEKKRQKLMPIAENNPLPELKKALLYYQKRTSKRTTLELVLMEGTNDSKNELNKLIEFSSGLNSVVNIIPWNPVQGMPYKEPKETTIAHVTNYLIKSGITVTRRYSRGRDVRGACGQLGTSMHS